MSTKVILLLIIFAVSCSTHARQQVRIYTEISPPLQTMEEGEVYGTSTEIVRDILDRTDLRYQIQAFPWARAYDMSLGTPNSLIYLLAKTPEREEHFEFLYPIYHFQFHFISLNNFGKRDFSSIAEVLEHRVLVQRNDIAHLWLESKGFKEDEDFLVCADFLCSWRLMVQGRVDMVIEDPRLAAYLLEKQGLSIDDAIVQFKLPELHLTGYLAANKKLNPIIAYKIKRAINSISK